MADPILPTGIRVLAVFQGGSGLPEDRYITTWAFQTADANPATSTELEWASDAVIDFYTMQSGAGPFVQTYLGGQIDGNDVYTLSYRMGQAPPRDPTRVNFSLSNSSTKLPAEVAACLSFYADSNRPGNRGRVFVGPLGTNAIDTTDPADARLTGQAINALRDGALRLLNPVTGRPAWSVLSKRDGELKKVTNGWVDNAFDIQRRRGADTTVRTNWG